MRICLITPGHLASTPRLTKAADALEASGYEVRVIASNHYAPVRPLDESILATARWACHRLPPPSALQRQAARVFRHGALRLLAAGLGNPRLAALALHPEHARFRRAAAAVKADLYIGHTLGGLAAAAGAAQDTGALLGFDAEDWHREEIAADQLAPGEKSARILLEETYLPRCAHLTAASPLIGEAYAPLWQRQPPTVLNVFPRSEAPARPPAHGERTRSLYWFSQTIGAGRGLEQILPALPAGWTLQLRGQPAAGYAAQLPDARIGWLDSAAPAEMVRLSASHRIGLGVELRTPENRNLCLTNKIFTYLLAGTPVLLSDTAAHRRLLPELGAAAALADLNDAAAIAAAIRQLDTPAACEAAWSLGQSRFNWDLEQNILLDAVRRVLSERAGPKTGP